MKPFIRIKYLTPWFLLASVIISTATHAQIETSERNDVNAWRVGIISGGVTGTYVRFAAELANVLDDGNNLRVVPMLGKGSLQNIVDILYLRGVDIGIVQSDVLTYIVENQLHRNIKNRIHYISKLYNEEIHLLGLKRHQRLQDLRGGRVNFGKKGSGTAMTAETLFRTHGIEVTPMYLDQDAALEKLKNQELDALVYVAGKPVTLFGDREIGGYAHFVAINFTSTLANNAYLPGEFTAKDYPGIVSANQPVDTIAVGAVMAVYNWDPTHPRYKKVKRFVKAFFSSFEEFKRPPRHPKWHEVALEADVGGWTRFKPASALLSKPGRSKDQDFEDFEHFLRTKNLDNLSDAEKQELFQDFKNWKQE